MSIVTPRWHIWILLILLVSVSIPVMGSGTSRTNPAKEDTLSSARLSAVNDVGKRVDSLQFVVVYNAELLRQDLGTKVVWIYVMLGVMVLATMMMFGALNQAQRQRKDLEERIFISLSTSVASMEAKIKHLESEIGLPVPHRRSASPKKKKTSRKPRSRTRVSRQKK